MAAVRLVCFSYTYSISDGNEPVGEFPREMDVALQQARQHDEAFAPTPIQERTPSQRGRTDKTASQRSSLVIPLQDIERVLPIYLRVYYKHDGKTKRSLVEYEVKNNECLYDMLAVMLRKLKILKGKTEAVGRLYYTQRKFRNPAELDFKSYSKTIIEDLAEMGKSMFFVFDMAGRLDPKAVPGDKDLSWVITLRKSGKERQKCSKEKSRSSRGETPN
ncbi:unnamed protein product [Nippostrongylus brasiliensis]|uniref:ArgoN domain-containing protein n=1 Tax=Nippostrongylus brasiliensis TaxID=27835 RepID=A0A158R2G3_NIPBR|nr:hypothetical protein Q1695_002151 [Nippostrongylus brasiliensis]VDL79421.1 unnamed protein product [Nippostrongylus brasiliensis]